MIEFLFFSTFPSSELKAVLQRNTMNVSYFKGTVLDGGDCERVKVLLALHIYSPRNILIWCNLVWIPL